MSAAHTQTKPFSATNQPSGSTLAGTFDVAPADKSLLVANVTLIATPASYTAINGWAYVPAAGLRLAHFWKVAGPSEPAAQSFATFTAGSNRDVQGALTEYGTEDTATLDVSGVTADVTSPQDQAAIDPTNDINTVMVGVASNSAARTYSGQTIGGVAANERVDAATNSAQLTVFDRLNVNTGSSTFAAQATASAAPDNGNISLLIFKLTPPVVGKSLALLGVGA